MMEIGTSYTEDKQQHQPLPNILRKPRTIVEHQPIDQLKQENNELKMENQLIKRKLQTLSYKLDQVLNKKWPDRKRTYSRPQEVGNMRLQNAYKQCEIYRKECSFYKKKVESYEEKKLQEYEAKLNTCLHDNQQLRIELKNTRKMIKLQQKGLLQIGAQGYVKLQQQNDKLRDQVRKLRKQLSQSIQLAEANIQNKRSQSPTHQQNSFNSVLTQKKSIKQKTKRMKTEMHDADPNTNSAQLLYFLQDKVEKDDIKLRALLADKLKLRDMLDNAKKQLQQKDKENMRLKDKVEQLRKIKCQMNDGKKMKEMVIEEKEIVLPVPNLQYRKTAIEEHKQVRHWQSDLAIEQEKHNGNPP